MGKPLLLKLTDWQSVCIHGWFNPKRTLTWDDIEGSTGGGRNITAHIIIQSGVQQAQLKLLQPDVFKWVQAGKVDFSDVPNMLEFPVHPILHLNGNISTLLEYRYSTATLARLELDYRRLRTIGMSDKWMHMLQYSTREWVLTLGLSIDDVARDFTEEGAKLVFGMSKTNLSICVAGIQQ